MLPLVDNKVSKVQAFEASTFYQLNYLVLIKTHFAEYEKLQSNRETHNWNLNGIHRTKQPQVCIIVAKEGIQNLDC